jgi:hypothetical protein
MRSDHRRLGKSVNIIQPNYFLTSCQFSHPPTSLLLPDCDNILNTQPHRPNRQTHPDQICTPRKSVLPSPFFLNSNPAIGDPISEALDHTLQDIPSRVPNRERSGVMSAKVAGGTVTSAALKNPHSTENAMNVDSRSILIHDSASTLLQKEHSIHVIIAPM